MVGLFGCPTVINNVETIAHLPNIVEKGGEWFASIGCDRNGGTRLFCLSGHVERPGVYELPMGTPLEELIFEHGGGVWKDRGLKAVVPGGSSAPILTAEEAHQVKCDFDSLASIDSMLGSGGVMVLDDQTCIVKALSVVSHFYAHESCGQCTPCREGTGWIDRILHRILAGEGVPRDVETLLNLSENMMGTSICALSDAAALPTRSYVSKFQSEFEHHIRHKACDVEEKLAAALS